MAEQEQPFDAEQKNQGAGLILSKTLFDQMGKIEDELLNKIVGKIKAMRRTIWRMKQDGKDAETIAKTIGGDIDPVHSLLRKLPED